MDASEFTKIAIAAAVGAVVKEVISVSVRASKSALGSFLARVTPRLRRHWNVIDWCLSLFLLWLTMRWFFLFPEIEEPLTHGTVKRLIVLALVAVMQFFALMNAAERFYAAKTPRAQLQN